MGRPRLIQVTCPGCGAGLELDPMLDTVTCGFCRKSSFVHRPREPVAPTPPGQANYGHIHLDPRVMKGVGAVVAASVVLPLVIVGAVMLFLVIGGLIVWRTVMAAVPSAPPSLPPHPAMPPHPKVPGAPAAPTAGGACARAVACCKAAQPNNAGCDAMAIMGETECAKVADSLRAAARAQGRSCP